METTNSQASKAIGFLLSYLIFTTMLFLVGSLIGKIPISWTFLEVAMLSASLTATGALLRWWLS